MTIGRPPLYDLTGQRFGRLSVLGKSNRQLSSGHFLWECLCDCGAKRFLKSSVLVQGETQSCGCLHKELQSKRAKRHGYSDTPLHNNWMGMHSRCSNPKEISWKNYGGRGITVCPEWKSFEKFLEDMPGWAPGKSLERVDVNKGYSKDNCIWIDKKLQARNTRKSIRIEFNGQTKVFPEWCQLFGLDYHKTYHKFRKGLPLNLVFDGGKNG